MNLQEKNLMQALQQGLITWFDFFELWKKLDEESDSNEL